MRTAAHPAPEQLTAFAQGRLPAGDAAPIEEHLLACAACAALLERQPDDSLLRAARAARAADTAAATTTLPPQVAASDTPTTAPAPAAHGPAAEAPEAGAAVPPPPLTGQERYQVVRLLGRGGMGAVYEAEHRAMQRRVALKVISRALTASEAAVGRFRREVRAAARLSHPNIVTAFDADQAGDTHFLVMEYVEGRSLAAVLRERGPLPVAEACAYVRQAALGLQHAHERGMVHRDVKPDNLMLTAEGTVKVLDFGLAALTAERGADALTECGALMGTPDYMAPEQAEDPRKADTRADVYSLGCTLYQLLTGSIPYPADTPVLKILAHRERPVPELRRARPGVPAGLAAVVARLLAKKPEERYRTPGEVAAALEPFARAAPVPPPRKRRRLLAAVALAALFGGLALTGVVVYRVQTDRGELVITTGSDDVEVVIKQGGKEVRIIDTKTDQQITLALPSGTYELELHGAPQGLKLNIDKATLTRGEQTLAKVQRVAKPKPAEEPKSVRRLEDVIDLHQARVLVNDDFDDPKTSAFGWGDHEQDFKDGRIVLAGNANGAWGYNTHQFTDFACEVVARVRRPPHGGWGLALITTSPEKTHGVEVLLDDKGALSVVPTRWATDRAEEQPTVGPVRTEVHEPGKKFNSLVVLLRGGRNLEIFVNGREACEPILLKHALLPAQLQLASVGGVETSILEFESYKAWSLR